MPKMSVGVPHKLGKETALVRIKTLLVDLKAQHGDQIQDLKEEWSGTGGAFSFRARGLKVSGRLIVSDNRVQLSGNVPWAAMPFKGKIEQAIKQRATELLA